MKTRWVILILVLIILLGLLAAGLWFSRLPGVGGQTSDASYGLITSPLNGDVVFAGDAVYVEASFMLSHHNLAGPELYVDGAKYVLDVVAQPYSGQGVAKCLSDNPAFCGLLEMRTLWIPAQPGLHALSACMSGDQSQGAEWTVCSEVIKVMVTDLTAAPQTAGTYLPQAGDTLESVAHKFGLPPLLVAADNPGIEPIAVLPGDIPINIPADPSLAEPAGGGSSGSPSIVDKATMTVDLAVDKVYCYYSFGENYWTRLPASPGSFADPLSSQLDLTGYFRTLPIPPTGGLLALECWGWSGAALVPLGSGKTDLVSPASKAIQIRGDYFVLDVDLIVIPGSGEIRGPTLIIPPPQGLTNTNNLTVCSDHGMPALFCKFAIEVASEKGKYYSDDILVWDWLAPLFPPDDPTISWLTEIDGYHLYRYYPGDKPTLIKTITNPEQKAHGMPAPKISLPYPYTYFVRAFADTLESADSNHYTMGGTASGLVTLTISPVPQSENALSYFSDETRKLVEDCGPGDSGTASDVLRDVDSSSIVVGFYHVYKDGCFEVDDAYYRGSILFDLKKVEGPVSKAVLKYFQGRTVANDPDGFSEKGQSCADTLNIATELSTSGITAFDPYRFLPKYGYSGTIHSVDVTEAVRDWVSGTRNLGFLFIGRDESFPASIDRLDKCWSRYDTFVLNVTYFETSK